MDIKNIITKMRVSKRTIVITLFIILAVALRVKSITMPLVDDFHSFRQSQTAITIQDYFNHGFSILSYKTPVFGHPWQLPMEFPIYQMSVFCFMKIFGMTNIDLGCRIVSIIYFFLSAFALLFLCKKFFSEKVCLPILFCYLFLPHTVLWSRAALPDFASVFFALLYIKFFSDWLDYSRGKTNLRFFASVFFGCVCFLCKSTSAFPVAVILSFLIVYFLYEEYTNYLQGQSGTLKKLVCFIAVKWILLLKIISICIIPLVIGLLWIKYTDDIKNGSIYTQFLTSDALKTWNYGTIKQRLSFDTWKTIFGRIYRYFSPYLLLTLFPVSVYGVIGGKIEKKSKWFYFSLPIAILFTLLSLTNLYWVHDYYLIALSPYISVLLGFGLYYVFFEFTHSYILKGVFIVLAIFSLVQPKEYFSYLFMNDDHGGGGAFIKK